MPTRTPNEESPARNEPMTGDPHPVEHFVEVLLIAQDRAAQETDMSLRRVWQVTVRDIETILADDTLLVVEARDRLAKRTDAEGRRMYACTCRLLSEHDSAKCEARKAIERAQRGQL